MFRKNRDYERSFRTSKIMTNKLTVSSIGKTYVVQHTNTETMPAIPSAKKLIEEELGIAENNKRIQDLIYLGKKVELKAQRSSTTSPVTLFSQKPKKPNFNNKAMLMKYGYTDKKRRLALYVTLKANEPNPQGLMLRVDKGKDKLYVSHSKDGDLWFWDIDSLKLKIERLLFVVANSKRAHGKEYFHYVEAYFLTDFNKNKFFELMEQSKIVVDIRMYLKKSGAVRDHGIAFRGKFKDFKVCYDTQESLIGSPPQRDACASIRILWLSLS